jgi:hypothetical protein
MPKIIIKLFFNSKIDIKSSFKILSFSFFDKLKKKSIVKYLILKIVIS